VNRVQRAVLLPAGRHTVHLAYRPYAVMVLWWLWALTTIGIVVAAIVRHRAASTNTVDHGRRQRFDQ